MLNLVHHDGPQGVTPLVVLHGLFGSAKNWGSIARALSEERPIIAVDMRNHGESFHAPDMSYDAMADDVAEVIASLGGEVDLLGHSMGGKAAMRLAERGDGKALRRLIIADIAPVAYEHSHMDLIGAMASLDLSQISRRGEADRALAERVPDRGIRGFLLQSLDVSEGRWRLGLDHLREGMDEIVGYPEDAGRYEGELLILRGGASDYVQEAHWPEIERRFPKARLQTMEGVGHWLHAEAPDAFIEAVRAELSQR